MNAHQALQIILREMDTAGLHGFQGIAFDDPVVRPEIWVSYVKSVCIYSGKSQKYPRQMWPAFKLAFDLLDFLFTQAGYPSMIQLCHEPREYAPNGLKLMLMFAGPATHPEGPRFVGLCAKRVAEVISILERPLENPGSLKFVEYRLSS